MLNEGKKFESRIKIYCMKEETRKDNLEKLVDEIISELPFKERVSFANLNEKDFEILQHVFDLCSRSKIDAEYEDEEYRSILKELRERLQKTHRLRLVKSIKASEK